MSTDCNATIIAYVFLACFDHITERERDVVRFIIHMLSCFDVLTGEMPMTQNVALLAQIYVDELCVMAAYYRRDNEEFSWNSQIDPQTLLNYVLVPLTQNLTYEQHQSILRTLDNAEAILDYPVDMLDQLVASWKSSKRNRDFALRLNRSSSSLKQKRLSAGAPRSECLRELELLSSANMQPKSQAKPKSRSFRSVLPNFGIRSRLSSFSSPRSRDLHCESRGKTDPYHVIDEAFEKELQELVEHGHDVDCLCHTGHLCFIHTEGHPCDYESRSKLPSRRGFGRRLQAGLKMVMPSR